MIIKNIAQVMAFRTLNGHVFPLEEITHAYPIRPAGTLTYYGIVDKNVEHFKKTGRALNTNHRAVLDNLLATLESGYAEVLTFELVLEPLDRFDPYGFVAANAKLLVQLAAELKAYQEQAEDIARHLDIFVRYASEMNDVHGSVYAGQPAAFKSSFASVREIFAERSPRIKFPFSPALRADLHIGEIGQYWPGDTLVDVIGATWYVHGENQRHRGMANMRNYFLNPIAPNKPFAIDEFGGAEGEDLTHYFDNDAMLKPMVHEIEKLSRDSISFAFGTIFLDDHKYGVDATLKFLAQ